MNHRRVRQLNEGAKKENGPVVYWMSRDQRVQDNWALLYAKELAQKRKLPLVVLFALAPKFLGATRRQYDFMLRGLEEVEQELQGLHIPFELLLGEPSEQLIRYIHKHHVSFLVTDFDPLRIKSAWKKDVARKVDIPVYEVDAHNIVPAWIVSEKREYGAYTLRPKINRLLQEFLEDFPKVKKHRYNTKQVTPIDWAKIHRRITVDEHIEPIGWLKPGKMGGMKLLKQFIAEGMNGYDEKRNDPNQDAQSGLSAYLHFGQISAQRVALEVKNIIPKDVNTSAFLEELIVRRELSDNFCLYEPNYDSPKGFPEWAKRSFDLHKNDPREYVYSVKKFEQAQTHDVLWNAAQMQMVRTGKMHGYMRMYWAKKILEWTRSPEDAMRIAIYLNDRYELDGRYPNGYVGIAWAIGGVHDRAWFNRVVFGNVRYMNANGCAKKFSVKDYVERWK